ncbi:flagellar biosynthetic protein FliR [Mesorhizobium sp.]|nr:flagellar biosynthetic protein FliR [Mesorhizobium sp.]
MGIPFWAAEAAGDILDLQRGSTMGTLIDPMMTHETSATGTLLAVIMVTIYLAAGGLELSLTSLYDSYGLWPIDQLLPVFSKDAAGIFLDLLNRILMMALTLVFPLIISMLLSDIVLAFLARASPHLNVFALSLIVKTLVFSLVFVLYSAFLLFYMNRDLGFLHEAARQIEAIGCRSCQ